MSYVSVLYVTVPSTGWTKTQMRGSFPQPNEPVFGDTVVGALRDTVVSTAPDERAALEAKLGKAIGIFVHQLKCTEGKIACSIAFAIRCETIEEAMALPGYTHIYMFSGPEPVLPPSGETGAAGTEAP